jgi:hypothetical protein
MAKIAHISEGEVRPAAAADAAVSGLLYGLLAGLVMLVFLAAAGLLSAESLATVLGRFDPAGAGALLPGVLAHLAVSAVYGLLFGLAWRSLSRRMLRRLPSILGGLIFGLLLFVLAEVVLLPPTGSRLLEFAPAAFALAHIVYGIVLGRLFRKDEGGRMKDEG